MHRFEFESGRVQLFHHVLDLMTRGCAITAATVDDIHMHAGGAGDTSSPDTSSHGAAEALTAMHGSSANGSVGSGLAGSGLAGSGNGGGGAAPLSKLAASTSHANISTSLKAMTRHAPSSANLFSSLGGLSSGLSALLTSFTNSVRSVLCAAFSARNWFVVRNWFAPQFTVWTSTNLLSMAIRDKTSLSALASVITVNDESAYQLHAC